MFSESACVCESRSWHRIINLIQYLFPSQDCLGAHVGCCLRTEACVLTLCNPVQALNHAQSFLPGMDTSHAVRNGLICGLSSSYSPVNPYSSFKSQPSSHFLKVTLFGPYYHPPPTPSLNQAPWWAPGTFLENACDSLQLCVYLCDLCLDDCPSHQPVSSFTYRDLIVIDPAA